MYPIQQSIITSNPDQGMTVLENTPQKFKTIGRLVGIGRRSGGIRIGVRGSIDSIHRNQCRLLLIARNASSRTTRILHREAEGIPILLVDSEEILGSWLGMNAVASVSVVNRNLASGILKEMVSLRSKYTDHTTE